MERCSFTIEGFVKFEQIYRLAVGGTPDAKQAIGTTGQQELGFFHIIIEEIILITTIMV